MIKSYKGVFFNWDKYRYYDGVVLIFCVVVKFLCDVMYYSQGLDNVVVVLCFYGKFCCFKIVSYEENMYKVNKIV